MTIILNEFGKIFLNQIRWLTTDRTAPRLSRVDGCVWKEGEGVGVTDQICALDTGVFKIHKMFSMEASYNRRKTIKSK